MIDFELKLTDRDVNTNAISILRKFSPDVSIAEFNRRILNGDIVYSISSHEYDGEKEADEIMLELAECLQEKNIRFELYETYTDEGYTSLPIDTDYLRNRIQNGRETELFFDEEIMTMEGEEAADELFEKFLQCPWLEQCGTKGEDLPSVSTIWMKNVSDVTKSITSAGWKEICRKERKKISEQLSIDHRPDIWDREDIWNEKTGQIKKDRLPHLLPQVEAACQKIGLPPDEILPDVTSNLSNIFMANYFIEYYESEFFERLTKVYLSGHLPCGWENASPEHPEGCILVF